MKKLLLTVGLVFGLSMNAHAVPVTFNIDELYDWGRLYSYSAGTYSTTNSNPAYFGGGSDTPLLTPVVADTYSNADGKEDTWGVGSIASITTIVPGTTFFQRSGAEELTFMFYGFDDDFLSSPSFFGDTTIGSKGGHIAVYLDTAPDFAGSLGTAGRTAADGYTGATEGLLVLDLVPSDMTGFGHTLVSNFDFITESGSGALFLNTSGLGAWDSLYDTNTQLFGSDFSLTFTVRNNVGPVIGDWVVRGDGGGEGNVIPEPASMMLLGSGLLGLVGYRRRLAV